MAEERTIFLTTIELPTYCFLSEAVEWVALGRVPQAQWVEEEGTYDLVEYRFYWREMPDNFEPSIVFPWFDRNEFEDLGVPISEEYFSAAKICFAEDVKDLPARIADYEAMEPLLRVDADGNTYNFWMKLADNYREKLDRLSPQQEIVDRVEENFRKHYEIAWAKLFQLLATCKLECTAIDMTKWSEYADEGRYEEAADFLSLNASKFYLGHDWKSNQIDIDGRNFVALRLLTRDIIENHDFLFPKGRPEIVERFGECYTIKKTDGPHPLRRRGRPKEANWEELKLHLMNMVKNNNIPISKESCIYELIAHSERNSGRAPSRSSVQRNLRDELALIYARNSA